MEINTGRQRVKTLIKSGSPDSIVKGELCINDDVVCSFIGCEDADFSQRFNFIRHLGLDLVSLSPLYSCTLKELPRPDHFVWPDLDNWVSRTSLFTFAVLDGAFEWGLRLLGQRNFFTSLKSSPLTISELVVSVEKLNMRLVQRLTDHGINGFILADDIAYEKGLFASPQILRASFIYSLARQVDQIRCYEIPVFFHSDGNYELVLIDIVNAGFNGLQCLDNRSGINPADIWNKYGNELCLWGHLDVGDLQTAQDSSGLESLTCSIHKLAKQGRFILGTTSGLFNGIDIKLLQTIYNSVNISNL